MGEKWVKVDPAEIKVGDRVRTNAIDKPDAYDFTVIERGRQWIGIFALGPDRTWYVRKPKPAKDTYHAELEAEVKELKVERDETQAQLDDALLTIAEKNTELEKWKRKAVALAQQMRADAREAELVRPDEPPVGSFFRVERTGETYWRHYPFSGAAYWPFTPYTECGADNDWCRWDEITEPGDTITILQLVEVKP